MCRKHILIIDGGTHNLSKAIAKVLEGHEEVVIVDPETFSKRNDIIEADGKRILDEVTSHLDSYMIGDVALSKIMHDPDPARNRTERRARYSSKHPKRSKHESSKWPKRND